MMKRLMLTLGAVGAMMIASPTFAQEEKAGSAPAAPGAPAAPAPKASPPPPPAATTATTTTAAEPKKKAPLMDLNTASADELKTLPGVDDALAQKIIAGRPYKGKDELWKKKLMDKDAYAKVRPLVVAKQPKAAKPGKPDKPAK